MNTNIRNASISTFLVLVSAWVGYFAQKIHYDAVLSITDFSGTIAGELSTIKTAMVYTFSQPEVFVPYIIALSMTALIIYLNRSIEE